MTARARSRIKLCGRLAIELEGHRVEQELPGRQGRLVFAYLAATRERPVTRDELIDALWPRDAPADPDETLSALLSKVRRALGKGVIEGRQELTLVLPPGTSIDLEEALEAAARADAALARSDWRSAWDEANAALAVASGGFLTRHDAPWVERRRREVAELRLRALECVAAAGTALGGGELAAGERAARSLIEDAPFRESGHRFLMAALAARGNVAEALQVYEDLRVLVRDELGTVPGAAVQALHERLLIEGAGGPGGAPLVDPLAAPAAAGPEPGATAREERKLVTIVFVQLAADERVDPELLRSALAPQHERVRAELEHFGGTVDRFVGGALLGVFGAPIAHEDDPERAVKAALRILQLAARVGVATGEALVSAASSVVEGEPLAHGHVVGVALGLQRAASVGTVLVDEATARATGRVIEYDEVEPVLLEGEPDRYRAWAARRVREQARTGPALTPFVGREHELALLEALARTVTEERRPRLVAIVGEPGVGKSRLTDELIPRIGSRTAIYRGRCLPFGEGITYWALREILWAAAGILLDDPAAAASAKLAGLVARLVEDPADAGRTTAALARTAGIQLVDSPLDRMTPESVTEEVGLAWPRFLGALAGERPTVVVVEDLHWAEAPLLDMLERLVSRATGPLLIVTTARPEFAETRPSWSSIPGMSQIGLEPLTAAQSRKLVGHLLPDVTAELRDRVVAPAEGNPFFTEEIVRHLAGEASTADAADGATIPNSVRALIAARIDALPEREKRTLQDAAVIGRSFWATTLESMAGGASVRSALRTLEAKGFVVANPGSLLPGELELSFRHALKREVAYRSIPRVRRCHAHAAVAGWIEEIAGDRQPEFVDLLAYHYAAAAAPEVADLAWPEDSPDRERVRTAAIQALLAAGNAARTRLAFEQAARYADRALALARTDAERLAGLDLRGSALHAAVRSDEAFAAYREAIELARKLEDADALSRLRAHAALLCARYPGAFTSDAWKKHAVELVESGLQEAGEETVSFEAGALLVARSAIGARWFDEPTGHEETAEEDARRAVEIADAIDSPYLLSHAVEALIEYAIRGGFCDAGVMAERLVRVCQTMPDRAEAHEGMVTATISFTRAGRYQRAREVARWATRESVRLSAHHGTHAAAGETMALVPAGRFAELAEVTERVEGIVRQEGGRLCQMGALGLAGRALALFECGEREAAQEALELFDKAPPPRGAVPFRCLAIDILRPLAGLEPTRRAAASLGHAPATVTGRLYELRLDLQLRALTGDWSAVDGLVAEARRLAPQACAPTLGWIADWAEAVSLAAAGDAGAVARATQASRALEQYGEPYTAARLLVDLLPFLDSDARAALAHDAGERLEAMGAHASAAETARISDRPRAVARRPSARVVGPV